MPITRHQLLVATTACTALAGRGGVLAQLPSPAPGLALLSQGELDIVTALADAFFPPGHPMGLSGASRNVAEELDRLLVEDLDPVLGPVFRHLLRGLEPGAVTSHGGRFSRLERPLREQILAEWSDPTNVPRRMAYDVLKTCVGWARFNAPQGHAALPLPKVA